MQVVTQLLLSVQQVVHTVLVPSRLTITFVIQLAAAAVAITANNAPIRYLFIISFVPL